MDADDSTRCEHPTPISTTGTGPGSLVDWLHQPGHYPDKPGQVRCVETHISWVFLTDRHAYKLKKPVRFDFLDFSTAAKRRQACEEEVRLNRRLARNVYLGVVPIARQRPGGLHLGGEGDAVDWLVKMRRLPADRSLDQLILSGAAHLPDVRQIAETLIRFYQQASPVTIRADEYLASLENHVRSNRSELENQVHGLPRELVLRCYAAQLGYLQLHRAELEDRVCDGRIVEGHGDLRPEHVYLAPEPVVIDCIEFNREFRLVDVADELSFLAMECDALRADWVGAAILKAYEQATGDAPPAELWAFYKCYRACVRAKVAAIRGEQLTAAHRRASLERAGQYLQLAGRYAATLGPPRAIVFRGLMGSGKSTLAAALAKSLGAVHLETDAIRRELWGPGQDTAGYDQGRYEPAARQKVYDELHRRAAQWLAAGVPVALDGAYLSQAMLAAAVQTARDVGSPALVIECRCPREAALERIARRQERGDSASEARPDLYDRQVAVAEPLPSGVAWLEVDTTETLNQQIDRALDGLRAN